MYRIFTCITQEHHYGLLALAVTICVVGATLSVLLLRRMIHGRGPRMWYICALSSVIGGATIWSTHFTAMLAYDPGLDHSYDFGWTVLSFGFAVVGLLLTNAVLTREDMRWRAPVAGILFGLTVSTMHYVGMVAYNVSADFIWEPERIATSILLGAFFGAVAYHRMLFPVTRVCWLGAVIGMVLAIATMHFMGMTSFSMFPNPTIDIPPRKISDLEFSVIIGGVTALLFLVGFTSHSFETNLERESRGRLRHAATHDHLTGLPNRLHLSTYLAKLAVQLDDDETHNVAILSVDLDLFKPVNDVYGHAVGDIVLCEIARRLSDVLQKGEFLARTGGDEFIAIKNGFKRKDEVTAFSNRLHAAIIEPINLERTLVTLGASIGIANTVDDGRDLYALSIKSDHALYRAKKQVDAHACSFNAEIDQKNQEKLLLINDLRNAVKNGELELVYQLQNAINTLEPIGFECLLRWNHPTRGRIPPNEFIPLAEETGLIRDIGLWVLRSACQEAVKWPRPYGVAVNVAPQQLVQPSFADYVSNILNETGLPAHRLELEITEASMINDQSHTLQVMHELKDLGIHIAMDDFGTGYSSLATLQAFPFDKIKIDRSFITEVHLNDQRAAIVRSTLLLGAALDIPILAEGVETQQELAFLETEKCSAVQGFYFGKPLSLAELRNFMKSAGPISFPKAV